MSFMCRQNKQKDQRSQLFRKNNKNSNAPGRANTTGSHFTFIDQTTASSSMVVTGRRKDFSRKLMASNTDLDLINRDIKMNESVQQQMEAESFFVDANNMDNGRHPDKKADPAV